MIFEKALLTEIISLFSFLYSGIKIDSFSFSNIFVSQFYIKIDKKLILDIDYIEYKSEKIKTSNSFEELKNSIELLPKVLKFFQKIKINKLYHHYNKLLINNSFIIKRSSYFNTALFIPIFLTRKINKVFNIKVKSEIQIIPKWSDKILYIIFYTESLILRYINFPFGVSLFSIVNKNK